MQKLRTSSSSLEQKKFIQLSTIFFLVLLVILISGYVAFFSLQIKQKGYNDSGLIYTSSVQLNKGENPYAMPAEMHNILKARYLQHEQGSVADVILGYNHGELNALPNLSPPFATMVVSIFSRFLTENQFLVSIAILNILAGLIAIYLLAQYFFKHQKWRIYLYLVLIELAFLGTIYGFNLGEITLLLNLLLILSCFLYKDKKDIGAGALLGFAVNIKLFFSIFLILFLSQRRYKALASFVIVVAGLGLLPLVIYGEKPYYGYLSALAEIHWYPISWNASFFGMVTRFFGVSSSCEYQGIWQLSMIGQVLYYSIFLFYALFTYNLLQKLKQDSVKSFALLIPCMLLLSPLGWYYYFPLLTLSFVHYFKTIQTKRYYQYYLSLLVILIFIINLPIDIDQFSYASISDCEVNLAFKSYLFICLFVFHLVQLYCYFLDKHEVAIRRITQKSFLFLATIFSIILIVSSNLWFIVISAIIMNYLLP